VWNKLRHNFVTKDNAAEIAEIFLGVKTDDELIIDDIFLFGSLAREMKDPNDIDLLLFNSGEWSSLLFDDYSREIRPNIETLENIFTENPYLDAAEKSGWFDYQVIDGIRFGEDSKFRRALIKKQRDPLFFVKISDNLLKYDATNSSYWVDESPQVFKKFADIKKQLQEEYIIDKTLRPT
jgi:predicted nucleotidyltransferase